MRFMRWGMQPVLGDQRILHAGMWRPARSLGWMVVLIFAIVLAFGPGMEAISHSLPKQPAYQFLAKVSGALIALGAYCVLVRLGEHRQPSELALAAAPIGIFAGVATGSIMFAAVIAIAIASGLYDISYHGAASAWRGAGLAIESGVLEELIVRGVVLRLVWRAFGPFIAFIASGLLFGVGHMANPGATFFTTACVAIEAGIMLGSFYALTGRLWVSIGVHAGWNFTQGYVFGAHVSGGDFGDSIAMSTARSNVPNWLTGGAFGPEASAPAFAICTMVGAIVLWAAWRSGQFSESSPRESPPSASDPGATQNSAVG
jgi:membrane protease YdiL (CAAX protease family)